MAGKGRKPSPYDDKMVRDISEKVYRKRLGPEDTASMIDKDKDNGEKLRARAGSYDTLTRAYLEIIYGE